MAREIVFGRHPVREVLLAGKRSVEAIFHIPSASPQIKDILDLAQGRGIPIKNASQHQLNQRTHDGPHQGILAVVEPIQPYDLDFFIEIVKTKPLPAIVIMDSIEDPHNFGAILRSAETFGMAGAIFPKDRSCDINSTVVKTSAGATEYMSFCRVTNISETIKRLRDEGFQIVAAEAGGDAILSDFEPTFPLAVVVGSEGKGVRPLVRKNCDMVISIPLRGNVSSLNVSAASAIFFYEISKRVTR